MGIPPKNQNTIPSGTFLFQERNLQHFQKRAISSLKMVAKPNRYTLQNFHFNVIVLPYENFDHRSILGNNYLS